MPSDHVATASEVATFGGNQSLVEALVRAGARFMVVGGCALRWHIPERPIGTNDLDLLIEATPTNAAKIIAALASIGVTGPTPTPERLAQGCKTQVKLDTPSLFADIITDPALNFDEHWSAAADGRLFGTTVKVAAPSTLRTMLADSDQPKHAQDRAILDRLLGEA